MTMNPLPPQAYTRETLIKASQWILTQSEPIKAMATTPDNLVSLYLKTRRDGESALDRPSIQNFKNELKNLTGLMGELEKPPGSPQVVVYETPNSLPNHQAMHQSQAMAGQGSGPSTQSYSSASTVHAVQNNHATAAQMGTSPSAQMGQSSGNSAQNSGNQHQQAPAGAQYASSSPSSHSNSVHQPIQGGLWLNNLDHQSRIMIQEVKESLNLSSDTEALRMMLKIGHKKALDILK